MGTDAVTGGPGNWRSARDGDLVDSSSFPHGPDRLFLVEIGLTYACQCRCRHCALSRQVDRGELLSPAEIGEVCRQAKEDLGAEVANLFGGEPLVRPGLAGIVEACARHLRVWVSTNGIGFTRDLARTLKGAGLEMAVFSLDSADPAEHDRIRAFPGCFDAVMEGVAACREAGIVPHLSAVATRGMLARGDVDRLIDLRGRCGAEKLCFLPAKLAGRFAAADDELLDAAELAGLWERIVREKGTVYVETEQNWSGNVFKCFCLRNWLYVSPVGVVQPCPYVFFDFGNVRETPLAELYARMHRSPALADRSLLNLCLMQNPEFVRRHFEGLGEGELVRPG